MSSSSGISSAAKRAPMRAVFSDLDGTLFNRQYHPSTRTLHVIHALRERGVAFVLATGRTAKSVFETIEDNHLEVDYVITNNGAAIYRCRTADTPAPSSSASPSRHVFTCVRAHSIAPAVAKQLFAVPVPRGEAVHAAQPAVSQASATSSSPPPPLVATNMFRGEDWFTTCRVGRLGLSYSPTCQPLVMPDLPEQDDAFFNGVIQVFFYGPHEHLVKIEAELPERFPNWRQEMEFSYSLPHILDVTAPGIHKGVAVEEVCGLLGVNKDETISFGDGMNDLAMLEATGHACIMSNAMPGLKEAMPSAEVIGHHDEDGVAVKLSALFDIPLVPG